MTGPGGFTAGDGEFAASVRALMTAPRQVTAVMRFRGGEDLAPVAAQAWAFEITYFFTRGVGEPPAVHYQDGVYTVTGMVQTTHPGDGAVINLTQGDDTPSIWALLDPDRQQVLREIYPRRGIWFDGRDHPPAGGGD